MSSSKRSRRHFTTEQKVAILKRHMVDKVPVSDLCNEFFAIKFVALQAPP